MSERIFNMGRVPIIFSQKCLEGYHRFCEHLNTPVYLFEDGDKYRLATEWQVMKVDLWYREKETQTAPYGLFVVFCDTINQAATLNAAERGVILKGIRREKVLLMPEKCPYNTIAHGKMRELLSLLGVRSKKQQIYRQWSDHKKMIDKKREYDYFRLLQLDYTAVETGERKSNENPVYRFRIDSPEEICAKNEALRLERNALGDLDEEDTPEELEKNTLNDYKDKLTKGFHLRIPPAVGKDCYLGTACGYAFDEEKGGWYLSVQTQDNLDFNLSDILPEGTLHEKLNPEHAQKLSTINDLIGGDQTWSGMGRVFFEGTCEKIDVELEPSDLSGLTENQAEAVRRAINTKDFLMVQGPPGTGKTTIIVRILEDLVERGERVLICSKNNLAVDNVLEKWIKTNDSRKRRHLCVRLGSDDSIKLDLVRQYNHKSVAIRVQKQISEKSAAASRAYLESRKESAARLQNFFGRAETVFDILAMIGQLANRLDAWVGKYNEFMQWPRKLSFFYRTDQAAPAEAMIGRCLQAVHCDLPAGVTELLVAGSGNNYDRLQQLAAVCNQLNMDLYHLRGLQFTGLLGRRMRAKAGQMEGEHRALFGMDSRGWQQALMNLTGFCGMDTLRGAEPGLKLPRQDYFFPGGVFSLARAEELRRQLRDEATQFNRKMARIEGVVQDWQKELKNDHSHRIEETVVRDSVKVIGATCFGLENQESFGDMQFDTVIIDEAGQILPHDIMVPIARAKKVILIGDHMQLPPMNENGFMRYYNGGNPAEARQEGAYCGCESGVEQLYSVSLFEMLYETAGLKDARVMLEKQFRMHPDIAEFISKEFYHGEYQSGITAADRPISIAGMTAPIRFIDTSGCADRGETVHDQGYSNGLEAEICAETLVQLIDAIEKGAYTLRPGADLARRSKAGDIVSYDIGVISGYSKQVERIDRLTREKLLERGYTNTDEIMSKFMIASVDSFQGRDNEIILYSMTRSNPRAKIGFLKDVRRLNVAMTRAKSMLIMVGDSSTAISSRAATAHRSGRTAGDYYRALVAYCKQKGYHEDYRKEAE